MLDVTTDMTVTAPRLQRVHGQARVRIGADGSLVDLHQSGSAKAILPKMHGRAPEVVFLNTSGGVTGGDHLHYGLDVGAGARAVGTTQTAERAYRSTGAQGRIETRLTLGAESTLHWLPQELILFEGAHVRRDLRVEMPGDAALVMLETLVLGRAAMGETLERIALHDRRDVIRDGKSAMIEAIRLGAEDLAAASPAGLYGAIAVATLSLFSPTAADRLDALRNALPTDIRAAASAWDGRVTARFLAPEAFPLRKAVARVLPILTDAPLPRVWQI
ncbi:MAG: urease accessory protein UreD [Pseudomonadota bacterium]